MIIDILRGTPLWVYALLVALLLLGLSQTRTRHVRPALVLLLPVAMAGFSLYATLGLPAFDWRAGAVWLAGVYFFLLRGLARARPAGVSYLPQERRYVVPGSWVPMLLILSLFSLRYGAAATQAMRLPFTQGSFFALVLAFSYGSFIGIFAARAWVVWRSRPGTPAGLPGLPWTRRAVAWSALALLVALDLATSLNAHFGYGEPAETWQPAPSEISALVWPPGSTTAASAGPGERLFARHCALCHGAEGRGNGAAAPSMRQKPRDLTRGDYKYQSTEAGSPPSDEDLRSVLKDGLHASGMPGFGDLLSSADIETLLQYVKGLSPVFAQPVRPLEVPRRPPVTSASIERGGELYRQQGCAGCHGEDLRGGPPPADHTGLALPARDLTAPWTFRGGNAPEQVFRRLSTGIAGSGMPAYAGLPASARWDLVAFLESRHRPAPGEAGSSLQGPARAADPIARGRHLVRAGMCGLCHTEVSPQDIYREDHYLAGGMLIGAYPQGVFVSRNLTPDAETGLGLWSEEEIAQAIRSGRGKDGRLLNFWGMPWMYLHNYRQEDALAMARYLKTLPAVRHEVPLPVHYGVIETVAAKIFNGDLLPARTPRITYAVGSYADLPGWRPDRAQKVFDTLAGWVLVLALLAYPLAKARAGAPTRGFWPALRRSALYGLAAVVVLAGYLIDHSPTFGFLPPERFAAGASGSIPKPQEASLSAEQRALLARGREIYATASCAYCHGNDGSGGYKVGGQAGSIFTPNISSHPQAGIGRWSDAQIARAIRAGISRDGRPLFWQGMPWDHFSNFDEEDLLAVVSYLRTLPPVDEEVAPYRPPAPGDCKVYTFWTVKTKEPGCR